MLDSILHTSCQRVQGEHAILAVTTLCQFLSGLNSNLSTHRDRILWEDSYWIRCFHVVLEYSSTIKGKPMKRLQGILISELARRKTSGGDISDALSVIFAPLRSVADRAKMKPALQALEGIISGKIVGVGDVACELSIDVRDGCEQSSESYQALFRKMLDWATNPELTQAAGKVVSRLWAQLRSELETPDGVFDGVALPFIWINPLVRVLDGSPESIPRFKAHVFPELFSASLSDFEILLKSLGFYKVFPLNQEPSTRIKQFDVDIRRTVLFSALDCGKQIGFVGDDGMSLTSP
jgi:hypothetical protein